MPHTTKTTKSKTAKPKTTTTKPPAVPTVYAVFDNYGVLVGAAPFDGATPGAAMREALDTEWIEATQDLNRLRSAGLSESDAKALFKLLGWSLTKATKKILSRYPG